MAKDLKGARATHVVISANPDGPTMAGLPTFFWSTTSCPLTWTESAFGLDLTISATVAAVHRDFGDGSTFTGGLGEPWPTRSRSATAMATQAGSR